MSNTPETQCWLLAGVVVTAISEDGETTVTLTATVPGDVDTVRQALATLATALQEATQQRRELQPCRP